MPSNCLLSEVWHTPGCAISEGHVIKQYCAMRGVDCEEFKKNALLENESTTRIGALGTFPNAGQLTQCKTVT